MSDFKLMQTTTKVEYENKTWIRTEETGSISWRSLDCTIEYKHEDPRDGWLVRRAQGYYWNCITFIPELEKLFQEATHGN
jgi:hypothetical protein